MLLGLGLAQCSRVMVSVGFTVQIVFAKGTAIWWPLIGGVYYSAAGRPAVRRRRGCKFPGLSDSLVSKTTQKLHVTGTVVQ